MWNEKVCYFCGAEHEYETEAEKECLKKALGSDYEE